MIGNTARRKLPEYTYSDQDPDEFSDICIIFYHIEGIYQEGNEKTRLKTGFKERGVDRI